MFGKILVGFDGSAHAHRALDAAIEVAGRFKSALTIVVVQSESPEAPSADLQRLYPLGDDGRPLGVVLDEARDRALAQGVSAVDSMIVQGNVVDRLLDILEKNRYDLVVVGSRGLTTGRRLILGSVSSGLVGRAPCPVLVVRPLKRGAGSRPATGATLRA